MLSAVVVKFLIVSSIKLINSTLMQKCDFLMAGVAPTFERVKRADLTAPWLFDCYDLLFVVQDDTVNINAVVKPFQWPVSERNLFHSHLTAINLEIILLSRSGWEC
jgi:hypothetical protein